MIENPLTQFSNRHVLLGFIRALVYTVQIDTGNLVLLVRNGRVLGQISNRQLRQHDLRGNTFGCRLGCNSLKSVGCFGFVCLSQDVLDIFELKRLAIERCFQFHSLLHLALKLNYDSYCILAEGKTKIL